MNLVAHQVLSFNNEKIQIGNFLGDFIRGKKYVDFEFQIALGIKLHREIDTFTDSNPIVHKAIKYFSNSHGKFAPIIVDVLFDYFLIKNWHLFRSDSFYVFINQTYKIIDSYKFLYSKQIQEFLKYMIQENWYLRYSTLTGIEYTLKQLGKRSKFLNQIQTSLKEIYLHEKKLEILFLEFYPILENHSKKYIELSFEKENI